jgi:hypothetical protein
VAGPLVRMHVWKPTVLLLALAACGKKQPETAPGVDLVDKDGSGMIVQPRIGGDDTDDGSIPFTITKVHTNQKPSATAPFHAAGGDWTYLEARLDGDPGATFVVGVPTFPKTGNASGFGGFGKLMFVPTTSTAGTRVVERLAKRLGTVAPAPRAGGVLQATKVPVALLGQGIAHLDNGMGGEGTWDATKLFCSAGDIDAAELFFNYSIADKKGEFSEKDTDYNKDVVACLATILRDGLPPPRTPSNDPTLTTSAPRLEIGKRLGGNRIEVLALTRARLLLIEERGDSAAVIDVNVETGATKDLYTTPDRIEMGSCDPSLAHCVLKLSIPKEERNVYSNDPTRLVLLEGTNATPLAIGSIERPELAGAAISPDGRFVIAEDYSAKKLVALDRTSKRTFELATLENGSTNVVSWDGTTAIVVNSPYDEGAKSTVLEWQLGAKGQTKPSTRPAEAPLVSPDGSRRVVIESGTLTVTAGTAKRTLVLHPDDAKVLAGTTNTWIDNRWLSMRYGFIDTDAMKIALMPVDPDSERPRIDYVPGGRIALLHRDNGVFLATVVGP